MSEKKSIFDSGFMQWLNKAGQAIGSNKFITALQQGMMGTMGPIMVGAVAQILTSVLGPSMLNVIATDSALYQFLYAPYYLTINAIALWESFLIGYHYGKSLGLKPLNTGLISIIAFMMVTGQANAIWQEGLMGNTMYLSTSTFGGTGIFTAIVVALVSVNVVRLCEKFNIKIKMPAIVPESLAEGFEAIVPLTLVLYLWWGISTLVMNATGVDFSTLVIGILGGPLAALQSIPGCIIVILFVTVLWLFGIHGTMVAISVLMAPMMMQIMANAAAVEAAGGDPSVLTFANNFSPLMAMLGGLACCGGTGNTMGLVLDALLFGKSEQSKAVAKAGLVPGWFGINEPVTFGFPIMYSPILGIPYVITPIVVFLLNVLFTRLGFLKIGYILNMSLLPMGVGEFLGTLSWTNAIWPYLMVPVSMLIYLPFFKVYDRQKVQEEQEQQ